MNENALLPVTCCQSFKCTYLVFYIQLLLLDRSERLLVGLCQRLADNSSSSAIELRVSAYLQLAEVAVTLHHADSAVQLTLAAIRMLQGLLEGTRQR